MSSCPCDFPTTQKDLIAIISHTHTNYHRPEGGFPLHGKPLKGMTKVYPNIASEVQRLDSGRCEPEVLTVWKKSLLFNCTGFTVFDAKGNLVFRVDNYVAGNKGEIVLMDAAGKPLLTIRRKKLSLGVQWLVFNGEEAVNPRFSVKKHVRLLSSKSLAHVTPGRDPKQVIYDVEGSFSRRCCKVYDDKRCPVAEIKCKEAAVGGVTFGADVFRLVVEPQLDTTVAMSLVIMLDQMYGPR